MICRAKGAAYHAKATERGKGEANTNLGPPHVFIATAAMTYLTTTHTDLEEMDFKEHYEQVKDLQMRLSQEDLAGATDLVPYWRLNKTHDEQWRLRCAVKAESHRRSVNWFLQHGEKGVLKVGRAPRGRMVRNIQKWIK